MLSAGPVCSCARFLCAIAHETAGAARTRSSLRPLFSRRANEDANLGRNASREREVISSRHRPRLVRRSSRSEGGRRTIQYSRGGSDGVERPQRTGYPAGACHRAAIRPTRWRGKTNPSNCCRHRARSRATRRLAMTRRHPLFMTGFCPANAHSLRKRKPAINPCHLRCVSAPNYQRKWLNSHENRYPPHRRHRLALHGGRWPRRLCGRHEVSDHGTGSRSRRAGWRWCGRSAKFRAT